MSIWDADGYLFGASVFALTELQICESHSQQFFSGILQQNLRGFAVICTIECCHHKFIWNRQFATKAQRVPLISQNTETWRIGDTSLFLVMPNISSASPHFCMLCELRQATCNLVLADPTCDIVPPIYILFGLILWLRSGWGSQCL